MTVCLVLVTLEDPETEKAMLIYKRCYTRADEL